MHDIRFIRENPDAFDAGLRSRGLEPLAAGLVALDDRRRAAVAAAQARQERRNALSREVGAAKKARDEARAAELMAEVARLKEGAPTLDFDVVAAQEALERSLLQVPNLPAPDVPVGSDESGNVQREEHRFEGDGSSAPASSISSSAKLGGSAARR
jgi:seryl-tRNA synthetase